MWRLKKKLETKTLSSVTHHSIKPNQYATKLEPPDTTRVKDQIVSVDSHFTKQRIPKPNDQSTLHGEQVSFSGPTARPQIKKKKREFSFKEELDEHWAQIIQEVRFRAFTHSSSFVGNVKYDQDNQTMEIILNGTTYEFCNVAERIFDGFEGANSKGAFFNRNIKTQFDC